MSEEFSETILVKTEIKEGGVQLSVADSGIGVLPENRQKVFELFYRVTEEKPSTLM